MSIEDKLRIVPLGLDIREDDEGIGLRNGSTIKPAYLEYFVIFDGTNLKSGTNAMMPCTIKNNAVKKSDEHAALYGNGEYYFLEKRGRNAGTYTILTECHTIEVINLKTKEILNDKRHVVGEILRMHEDIATYESYRDYVEDLYGTIDCAPYGDVVKLKQYFKESKAIVKKLCKIYTEKEIEEMKIKYEDYI